MPKAKAALSPLCHLNHLHTAPSLFLEPLAGDPESVFHASLFSRISFMPRVAESLVTLPITDQCVV